MTELAFRLQVLPGGNGDALVLEYGDPANPHRVLVDGGVDGAAPAVAQYLGRAPELELLVVTHIDTDHIGGILRLLDQPEPPCPHEVWFNGFRHLPKSQLEEMGPVAGERLTELILQHGYPWNACFDQRAVALGLAPEPPPIRILPGGLACTVLAPGTEQLRLLRKAWAQVIRDAGLDPDVPAPPPPPPVSGLERMGALDVNLLATRKTTPDNSVANGSSIVLLAEYAGRRVLLAGDAHSDTILAGIDRLLGRDNVLCVDVAKLPHHGSKANVTLELLRRVHASIHVFSTDGSGNQRHPNDEAVARVVATADRPVLAFNYRTERTSAWDNPALQEQWRYSVRYPDQGQPGLLTIDLMALPQLHD